MSLRNELTLPDASLFYTVAGTGDPLLLIHGNFNDHQIWEEQASLAAHYQVICPDLRGYGQSSTPTKPFSYVEDLKSLIDSLHLNKVTLIGSSLGGSISLDFAIAYPNLVKALVLVAPAVSGNAYPASMTWNGIKNYLLIRFKGKKEAIETFIMNPFWQYFFPDPTKQQAYARVLRNVRNPNNFCRVSPRHMTVNKPYAKSRLSGIRIPTLIIISDHDHPHNIETANLLHREIKDSSKIVIPDCGHLPFVEKPQQFNSLVLQFLQQSPVYS